jgi:hypothetical protein
MKDGQIMNGTKQSLLFGFSLAALLTGAVAQQPGVGPTQPAMSVAVPIVTTSGTTATVSSCCGALINTIAGNGTVGNIGDGTPATTAELSIGIRNLAVDASGDVFFIDDTNATARVVYEGGATAAALITAENPTVTAPVVGNIYLIAGVEGSTGVPTSGALASSVHLTPGSTMTLDAAGDLYYNDTATNKIWVIYAGGTNSAGTNLISLEAGIAAPVLGHLYPVAGGSATVGYAGDGSLATASNVQLYGVGDVKFSTAGDMYITDTGNNCIRVVNHTTGIITTFAGGASSTGVAETGGTAAAGSYGLNGPAVNAQLNAPYGIAVDAAGDVYISDKTNHEVKVVYEGGAQASKLILLENPTITTGLTMGDIYLVAGSGSKGTPYGYLATLCSLNSPTMVALDAAGDLYIMDNGDNVVQEVNPSTGILVTVAGNGTKAFAGDGGLAINAEFNSPRAVAVDPAGRLYITDASNARVREVSQGLMSFVGQAAGTKSADELLQLTNTGNATLTFTATPTIAGTNANDFAVDTTSTVDTCFPAGSLITLAPGVSCNLALTYAPTNSGTSAATMSIATNDSLTPQVITLQGQLTPAATTLAASATTAYPGAVVTLTATVLSPSGTPTGTVTFYQGSTALTTTAISLPSNGSGTIVYTLPALSIGASTYTAVYSGDTNFAGSTSTAVTINVDDFSISATPTTLTVVPGQAAQTTLTIVGSGPSAQTLSLSCTAPNILGCSFTPASASVGIAGTTTVTVSIAAVATTPVGAIAAPSKGYTLALLPLAALLMLGLGRRRRSRAALFVLLLCLGALGILSGCNQPSNFGTPLPASTQTVTVNVSSVGGTVIFSQSIALTINVQ